MRQLGIFPNLLAYSASDRDTDFVASDGTCRRTDYKALARAAGYLATSPDVVRPFILDLTWVIFQKVPGPGYPQFGCPCDRSQSCDPQPSVAVRADYASRLTSFKNLAGGNFPLESVFGIVLNAELTNGNRAVADPHKVNEIATEINNDFPGIPVIGGYPTEAARSDYGMADTPLLFPHNLDYILTWDYSTGDPSVGRYPTMYNDRDLGLFRRLLMNQRLIYVAGIFNLDPTHCPAQSVGNINNGARYDFILRKWCAWALKTPDLLT